MPGLILSAALAAVGRAWSQWWPWARTRTAQIAKGHAGVAIAIVAGVVAILLFVGWLRGDAASTAIAARDSTWREKLAAERLAQSNQHYEAARRAAEAAAKERRDLEADRDQAIARAADLELQLQAARQAAKPGADPDPVIYPRNVARALRGGDRK